ncbi:MAG: SGNH/GDSL hydrolase family protein [Phycisphaerales bacterium]|nr:MAG: SGNH/GDSL hydrolase family protein [Phycisphaerales bacterium]
MNEDREDSRDQMDDPPGTSGTGSGSAAESPGAAGRTRRHRAKKLLLSAGTVLILVVVAEIALRAGHLISKGTWDFLPAVRMASELYEPHPYLCYAMKPGARFIGHGGQTRINRWGCRGRDVERVKPDGVVRIACLGGSTTFSLNASDNDHTWPAQLERILNERHGPTRFEVLNFGTPGYCVVESFLIFSLRAVDLDPDIILMQDALNDVYAVFRPDVVSDYTHFRGPYTRLSGKWLGRSAIGRLVIAAAARAGQPSRSFSPTLSKEGVRLFQRYVESTVLMARAREIQPVIVTMPDRLPRDEEECRKHSVEIALTRVLIEGLRRVSRGRNVPLIDLSATFPKDPRYFTDDTHKTDEGLELAARMIADGLQQNGVLARALEQRGGMASD